MVTTHAKKSKKKGVSKPKKSSKLGYQQSRALAANPKAELKAFDTQLFGMLFKSIAAGGNFALLNAPIRGTDIFNRTGRKIYMKSVHIKGYLNSVATTSLDAQFLRLMLVYDANPNTGTPLITDVLLPSANGAATSVMSHVNLDNRQRFRIVREWRWFMGGNAGASVGQAIATGQTTIQDGHQCLCVDEYVKLDGLETVFNVGAAGTIADLNEGALFLVGICDSNATGAWNLQMDSRLRFFD